MNRRCKHCGQPLLNNQRWYCNTKCAVTSAAAAAGQNQTCLECGSALTGKQKKYCSQACNSRAFKRKSRELKKQAQAEPKGTCIECEAALTGQQRLFCSARCRSRRHEARQRAARRAARPLRACPECGTPFKGPNNKIYCSPDCQLAAHKARRTGGADRPLSAAELREVPSGPSVREVIARVQRANPELAAHMRTEQAKWEAHQ